jgi:hypothetical protein
LANGKYGIYKYEVHIIRVKKAGPHNKGWNTVEYLARDEEFGMYAWSYSTLEGALCKYKKLIEEATKGGRSKTG